MTFIKKEDTARGGTPGHDKATNEQMNGSILYHVLQYLKHKQQRVCSENCTFK